MSDQERKFIDCLDELIVQHRRLIEILKTERRAMIDMDSEAVNNMSFAKAEVSERIKQTEKRRHVLAVIIARNLGIPGENMSAEQMISAVGGEFRENCDLRIKTLKMLLEQAMLQNRSNSEFIIHSMNNLEGLKKSFLGLSDELMNTYAPRGEKGYRSNTEGRLLSKRV